MSTQDQQALEAQLARRKRVNRMKSAIILTISIWMLVSFLSIIILSVCLFKVSHKVRVLEHIINRNADITQDIGDEITTEQSLTEDSSINEQGSSSDNSDVIRGIDTEDNFAEEGDLHEVYLTFNSVPGENTRQLLDVLNTYQVKATFFVSGEVTEENQDIIKRIVDEGHTLGMHSFSNQYSTLYASVEAFENDYKQISDYLYRLSGVLSNVYRFPGGSGNEISNLDMVEFVRVLNQNNVTYFDWNVSGGDASSDYTAADVVSNVTEGIKKYRTSVVLLHDDVDKAETVEAITPLIMELSSLNTQLLPINENTKLIQYIKADSVK